MGDQQQSAERLRGAAAVACASCRRLKMRCIGAANPPCTRCLKTNRECVVRLPNRQQLRLSSRSKASTVHGRADPPSPNSVAEVRPSPAVTLTHSPTAMVANDSALDILLVALTIATTKVSGSDSHPSIVTASQHRSGPDAIPDSVIRDLVEFFLQRLICYTPVLSLEPLSDLGSLVASRRPLAYAMAFVASTLSLGYSSTRLALFPHMSRMLEQANDISNNTQEENWTLLQALAVLYSYPRVAAVSGQVAEKQLSPWAVKSAVETCAMQLSLHQSVEDLKTYLKSPHPNISSSFPYRRTFYWIWLFVKSRHHSVITRTPPTIRNDSTITATLDLLPHLDPEPGVWRVLAEAALHHQWDQAARPDKDLAEWWCVPCNTKDIGTLSELLENAENLLQEWSATWLQSRDMSTPRSHDPNLLDPSIFANTITAFMGILTRFSIVSFAAPIVSHQLMAKTGLATFLSSSAGSPELSAFLNCVLKSADAAGNCCDTIIELKPAAREALRYMPDYGFTMIALCCLHLVYAYKMCPDNPTLRGYLVKAEQVAYLMMDLCVGCNICPKVYGEYVLFQLRIATRNSASTDNGNKDQNMADFNPCPAIGHSDPQAWSHPGCMADSNQPLDSLFRVGLSNDNWPTADLNSDILLSNPELIDILNIYPDSLLHSNTTSL